MVVVITECRLINGVQQRNLVWRELLPRVADTPLPPDAKAYSRLPNQQRRCTLPLLKGKVNNPWDERMEEKTFTISANTQGWQSIQLRRDWRTTAITPPLLHTSG